MFVEINGARIHYERSGSGFPVILLHAGVADSRMWGRQVDAFARHFEVITADERGYGDSDLPPEPWSPVKDLLALMDHLDLKPAHLVGCSMGGALAIDFALDHPGRMSKLVLVGAGLGGYPHREEDRHLYAAVVEADAKNDLVALNEAEAQLWLDGPTRPRGYIKQSLRDLFLDMNGRSLKSDFDSAPREELLPPAAERLNEISAPTLVVVGDKDLPPILEIADVLRDSIAGARKVVINDAAHLPSLEHPDEFNRLVLDFLKS